MSLARAVKAVPRLAPSPAPRPSLTSDSQNPRRGTSPWQHRGDASAQRLPAFLVSLQMEVTTVFNTHYGKIISVSLS